MRRFICGDASAGIAPKFVGDDALVDRAVVSLMGRQGLMLVGESGTATSLLSELLAAAVSGRSTAVVQILEAGRVGAAVRFIDLPSGARLAPDAPPRVFDSEAPFDAATFIGEARARLGLRDGAELWDHLFETRLGLDDWRGFFAYAYCVAIRATTPPALLAADDTLPREAAMRAHMAAVAGRRAVVVTGGFHTPALLAPGEAEAPAAAPAESDLVAYCEEALDALSGCAEGLR